MRLPLRLALLPLLIVVSSGCGPSGAATPGHQSAPQPQSAPSIAQRAPDRHAGSRDLAADEAMGGHTLHRHVGRSDDDLRARLEREPQISSASTYTDRATAERVVGAALEKGSRAFTAWRERSGVRPNFALRYRADGVIGRSIARGHAEPVACDRAVIVLRWDQHRDGYYVLTSYPEEFR